MKFDRWDIWLARVAYEDQPDVYKERPVVVYSETEFFVLSLKVSSQNPHTYRDDYELRMWKEAGLHKPSFVSLRLVKIKLDDMLYKIGKPTGVDVRSIREMLENLETTKIR